MKNVMLAAAVSALAMFAQPALAAESISNGEVNFTNAQGNQTLNGTFGATKSEQGSFTDIFVFTLSGLFTGDFVIKTDNSTGAGKNAVPAGDIDLGPIFINGISIPRTSSSKDLSSETFSLAGVTLIQGQNTISVGGNVKNLVDGRAQFNGSVALTAINSAVPEPATWAMMLFGFGAVGYSMRSRKTTYRLAQAV